MEASHTENGQIPLILIHGAWLSARSWENYADYFGKRGFAVSAPEWPRKRGDVHLHPPTEVHFKNEDRAPLLIVGASEDHTVPASLAKAQYKRYARSPAKTEYLEFEGRPHLHMVAPDWEEVAASIDSWLDGVLDEPVAAQQAS